MRITTRDFEVLRFLGAQGVATADQLTDAYFPSRGACLGRLHFLKHGGFVESLPLSKLKDVSQASFNQAVGILELGRSEIWKHRIYRLSPRLRSKYAGNEALSSIQLWKHQIQLNGVRSLLKGYFPGATILTDPEVRAELRRFGAGMNLPIPDLVIRQGDLEIAVEVERTMKSEREYFTRFLRFEAGSHTHVLYFCESDDIFNKVSELSRRISKFVVALQLLSPELVYQKDQGYVSLSQFLGQSWDTPNARLSVTRSGS